MGSWIGKLMLKLIGWKITGYYPHEIKKFIVLVAPHTSNWDFPIGIFVKWALKADIKYVAKHTLFKPGIGWLFKALGGYPVNRTKRTNFSEAVINIFDNKEAFVITISPEGHRRRAEKFKTGIYYIARGAQVPIVPCKFDWAAKEVHFGEPFHPTDDKEGDMKYLWNYFVGVQGKNPEDGVIGIK